LAITSYAADGDINAVTDSVNGTWAYTYDNLRRLKTATLNPSGSPSQLTWAYDGWGNQTSQTITAGTMLWPTDTFTYTVNNQIMQDGYDAAGNMINDGFHAYTYDDEGQIISVGNGGTATYVYNADSLRVHRVGSEGPEDYAYDLAGHAVTTILPGGGPQRREVYAGSFHVATYDNGTTFLDHTDWQATERVRSNVSGVSVLTCTNLPYGDNQSCVGPLDPSPQHFTGKMRDPETGLDYFGARYYSSGTARWMLPDWSAVPAAVPYADIGNPQSLNLYTYVGNNPINGVDVDGHTTGENGQPCGQVGMQGVGTGGQGGGALGEVPCGPPPAAGDPTEFIVDGQVQQPGSLLIGSQAVAQCPNNQCTGFWASAGGAMGYPDIPGGVNDWNGKFYTNAQLQTEIIQPGIDEQHAELAARISLMNGQDYATVYGDLTEEAVRGGNADFSMGSGLNLNFLSDATVARKNRMYGAPSVHMDNGTIHLDTVSPYSYYGLGLLGHFFIDVVLGTLNNIP
jgi:RHS repeat-associated protein